jgi:hypothetical protein
MNYFLNIYDQTPKPITMIEIINLIKSNELKDQTDYYRKLKLDTSPTDELGQDILKKSKYKFPGITFSSTFKEGKRDDDNFISYTPYICIDFDHIENINDIIEKLKNDKYTLLLYKSVSGDGCKVVVKTVVENTDDLSIAKATHEKYYEKIKKYYYETYNLKLDTQCKNYNRINFLSYDENVYYNSNTKLIKVVVYNTDIKKSKIQESQKGGPNPLLNRIYEFMKTKNLVHPDLDDYTTWIVFGWRIYDYTKDKLQFIDYFKKFSQLSSKYNEKDFNTKITNLIKTYKPKGYSIKKLTKWCKDMGMEFEKDEKELYTFDQNDIHAMMEELKISIEIIQPGYKHYASMGEQNNTYYIERQLLTDHIENEIFTNFIKETEMMNLSFQMFERYLFTHKFINHTDTVKDFFYQYNSGSTQLYKDEFKKMVDSVDVDIDKDLFKFYLRYWMLSSLYQYFANNYYNKYYLIAKGNQNIGKTWFFDHGLFKPFMENSMCDTSFSWKNIDKDSYIKLAESLFIFTDDVKISSKTDIHRIKEMTSMTNLKIRRPFGRNTDYLKRIGSFAGSTNDKRIYADETGGIRFFVFEILSINREIFNSINFNYIWMMIFDMYINSITTNMLEQKYDKIWELHIKNTENNRQISREEELLQECVIPNPDGDPISFNEIGYAFKEMYAGDETILKMNSLKFLHIMEKLGFECERIKNKRYKIINGYRVRVKRPSDNFTTDEILDEHNFFGSKNKK